MPRPIARRIAAAAFAAALAAPAAARAQVVYSGPVHLTIPPGLTGLFVNVVTGTTYTGPGAFPTCPGPGCNYDFNVFGTTTRSFFAPGSSGVSPAPVTADQRGYVSATAGGNPIVLTPGTLVGGSSIFNGGVQATSAAAFEGGTGLIFGFRFRNEAGGANTVHYGWARITLPAGAAGTLVDYAFNATAGASIAAGDTGALAVIPEPSTYALVGAGLAGVAGAARRRRRAA